MRSNKLLLLIGMITCGIGITLAEFCISNKQPETAQISSTQHFVWETRFDRAERAEHLQLQADELLPLFDSMPPVSVYLKDEPILPFGTNTERSLAYTICDNSQFPSIIFKRDFYQKANQKKLVNILKHELTHAWLCRQNLMSVGHGAAFQEKFKSIGGWGS